jgi:hypothetical protein
MCVHHIFLGSVVNSTIGHTVQYTTVLTLSVTETNLYAIKQQCQQQTQFNQL